MALNVHAKMKTKLPGFLTLFLLCGCTKVAVVEPLGTPISDEDAAELTGTWVGAEKETLVVAYDAGSDRFNVGKPGGEAWEIDHFSVRGLDDEVFILWAEDKETSAYLPMRIAMSIEGNDGFATLFYPDAEAVERLVESGRISGEMREDEKAWILQTRDLAPVLLSKDFWRMDVVLPFVKIETIKEAVQAPDPAGNL